jgi:DNA-binding GntR family transcriptional regulator
MPRISHRAPKPVVAEPVRAAAEPPLADRAYRAILQGLFDRTIPAGAELSQAELMTKLGITAQPLRDALLKLEAEGLVTIHARSCIRFVKADLELSRATYQFRSLIERAGARAFAEMGDAREIEALVAAHMDLIARIEASGLGMEESATLGALENRFHGALLGALRNPLIETTARRLKNYVTLVRLDWLVTAPLALRTLREHLDVLHACARRDADGAEAALTTHFQQALQRLLGMA